MFKWDLIRTCRMLTQLQDGLNREEGGREQPDAWQQRLHILQIEKEKGENQRKEHLTSAWRCRLQKLISEVLLYRRVSSRNLWAHAPGVTHVHTQVARTFSQSTPDNWPFPTCSPGLSPQLRGKLSSLLHLSSGTSKYHLPAFFDSQWKTCTLCMHSVNTKQNNKTNKQKAGNELLKNSGQNK